MKYVLILDIALDANIVSCELVFFKKTNQAGELPIILERRNPD
jgi:hypothetical protein